MNQGLNLTYGFNHAEAGRAFAEAARLDPSLAIAYWGQALVLGPNINAPMDAEAEPKALALIQKAIALKPKATARERAYIDALAARYTGKPEDRAAADRAYAAAMQKLTQQFPDDLDARTLYAESLMDLRPWGYFTRDGQLHEESKLVKTRAAVRDRSAPASPRRAAPVDSPVGVDRSEARRGGSRSARAADAGRRTHGPHGGAHLSARRPAPGRDRRQPDGGKGGRGLHRAVPRAGHLSARLLPA